MNNPYLRGPLRAAAALALFTAPVLANVLWEAKTSKPPTIYEMSDTCPDGFSALGCSGKSTTAS